MAVRRPRPRPTTTLALAASSVATLTATLLTAPAAHAATALPAPTGAARPSGTAVQSPSAAQQPAAVRGRALPLHFRTHHARRVLTVVAGSKSSTTATLRAWRKARGGGWIQVGHAVRAYIGSQGMTRHTSESKSATPIGSFTLTHAFGHNTNPGTRLPYLKTRPSDWWISEPGRLYNTHQRCRSNCPFTQGSPNEHLFYETPYYNYAVVIDYNTRNSPTGVRQGKGSAFFLHVSVGEPTAGCVAIPRRRLVHIMRWLKPRSHPRILIGAR